MFLVSTEFLSNCNDFVNRGTLVLYLFIDLIVLLEVYFRKTKNAPMTQRMVLVVSPETECCDNKDSNESAKRRA